MNPFTHKETQHNIFQFIVLGGLVIMGIATVIFGSGEISLRQASGIDLQAEEQRILSVLGEYIQNADSIQVHPTSLKLTYSHDGYESDLFLTQERGALGLHDQDGNYFEISSPAVEVSNINFEAYENDEGEESIRASFVVAPNKSAPRQKLPAIIFDSSILPVPGSQIELGTSYGDFSRINNTIYFSASEANVGIGTGSPSERLHVANGGIQITNQTSTFPTCDSSKRGTLWLTQPGGGSGDRFAVCLRQADQNYKWAEYQGL